jgi:hypothetical protein
VESGYRFKGVPFKSGSCKGSVQSASQLKARHTQHNTKEHMTHEMIWDEQEMVSVAQRVAPHVSRALESYLEGALEMEE